MAVPFIFIVEPKGRTKEAMALSHPRSSADLVETGKVAAEEVEVKAKSIAGADFLKNSAGELSENKAIEME